MTSRRVFSLLFSLTIVMATARQAGADLMPKKHMKFLPGKVMLSAGKLDDFVEKRRTVRDGDTFAKIAQEMLGDPARVKDIAALNPGVDAEKPAVGTALIIPPKVVDPARATEATAVDIYHWSKFSPVRFERVYPGETFAVGKPPMHIVLVPIARRDEFKKLVGDNPVKSNLDKILPKTPWIYVSEFFNGNETVDAGSKAVGVMNELSIGDLSKKDSTAGSFKLVVDKRVRVDAEGTVIKAGFALFDLFERAPFVVISIVGLFIVAALLRRRRAAIGS